MRNGSPTSIRKRRLKGNGVRVPDCPAAVSRPYYRARTTMPLAFNDGMKKAGKAFASGWRVRRPAETNIAMVSPWLFRCASRIGRERRNHYNDPNIGFG